MGRYLVYAVVSRMGACDRDGVRIRSSRSSLDAQVRARESYRGLITAAEKQWKLGRYELVRHLATGGMADVLLARATGIEGFERHVVLKRIHKEHAKDVHFVQMFLDEARLAAALHHHNIVQVYDIGQEAGEYFFAMEYLHGVDLRKILTEVYDHDQQVPIEHVVTIGLAAADALHHAHELRSADRKPLGIVHRDVSPANIIVTFDGNVKVCDFGIAKATQRTTETNSGVMKGKVAYMSPEQCVGIPVDRRSDIFCLGIVLYELVTVRRLFKAENDFLTMSSITQGVIPKPTEFRADLPLALEAIILRALAQNPADRFQTANELRTALEEYAINTQLRSSSTALADYMRSLFGSPPLPWEVDDSEPEMEISIDFDRSGAGIVSAPEAAIHRFVAPVAGPTSPIAHARTKAITNQPFMRPGSIPPVTRPVDATPPAVAPPATPAVEAGDAAYLVRKPAAHRGRWLVGVIAAGVIATALIAIIATRDGGSGAKPPEHVAAPPVAEAAKPAAAAPVAQPEPPPTVTATEASSAAEEDGAGSGVDGAGSGAVKKKHAKIKKPARPAHGSWDPNSLFPE